MEDQLEMFHCQMYKAYFRKNDMDDPPIFDNEDDDVINGDELEKSFERGLKHHVARRSSVSGTDEQNLHERFFRYGIRPGEHKNLNT